MNLYKVDIRTKKKGRELELIVHAPSEEDARHHVGVKYIDCTIHRVIELEHTTKHFVVAELEPDE